MLKKLTLIAAIAFSSLHNLYSDTENSCKKDDTDIIPLLFYRTLSLEEHDLRTIGGGLVILSGDTDTEFPEKKDSFLTALIYSSSSYSDKPLYEYPDKYKNINLFIQRKKGGHQYFSILKSCSDKPLTGGLETFAYINGYGYEIIRTERNSLYIGGSVAVSDWRSEIESSFTFPVIPLPYLCYSYSSPWVDSSFEFIASPVINIVIAPENKLRLNSSATFADLSSGDDYGIKYDLNIEYRFFSEESAAGDFAGIRAGIMSDDYSADVDSPDERIIKTGWKSYYTTLDLSLIEITAGFAEGKSIYTDRADQKLGSGMFFNIQLAYMF